MNSKLGAENIHKLLWELSIPATIGMLSSAIFNIVDRYFVGKIDPLALSGVGITMPIQVMHMAIILLIGVGASTLISIKLGEGDKEQAEDILWLSFKYILITMIVFAVLFVILQERIFKWLSVSEAVYPFAKAYILPLMTGAVFGIPGYCLNNSLRSIGRANVTMYAILYSSILNVILDPLFIFVFHWGVEGAAIATVVSQIALTGYIIQYFIRTKDLEIRLKFRRVKDEWFLLKEIFAKGSPTFYVQILASLMGSYINTNFIRYGSDLDVASLTIISTIFTFYHMLVFGIVQGNQPIVGYNWGSRQYDRVRKSLELSAIYAFLLSTAIFLVIQIYPAALVSLFTKDSALISIASAGMKTYLLALPILGVQVIGAQYFQSVGKFKLSSFLLFLRYGIVVVPSIWLLVPKMGVRGIYLSNAISDFVASVIAIFFILLELRRLRILYEEQGTG